MIYLDYAATTPVDRRVVETMIPYYHEHFANPSSKHQAGYAAASAVENARRKVGKALGSRASEIIFTGGASESNNLAIKGIAEQYDSPVHFIASSFEHKATIEAMRDVEEAGHAVTFVPPNPNGIVDPDDIAAALRDDTALISVMHVNNEIGTIQPIREISALCEGHGCLVHTDATQSFGKMNVDVEDLGVDLLSLSAHKFYGPKGVGALYVRDGLPIKAQIAGGSQELGRRAGTLNVPGIVGLGRAAEISQAEMESDWKRLEDYEIGFLDAVQEMIPGSYLQGSQERKVPWISNICFADVDGQALRECLNEAGVCVSRSSACAISGAPSHVLEAIQCPENLRRCAIRFSFGRMTTVGELKSAFSILRRCVDDLRDSNGEVTLGLSG